jgi:hypothetical protein
LGAHSRPLAPSPVRSLKKYGKNRQKTGEECREMALSRGPKAPFCRSLSRLHSNWNAILCQILCSRSPAGSHRVSSAKPAVGRHFFAGQAPDDTCRTAKISRLRRFYRAQGDPVSPGAPPSGNLWRPGGAWRPKERAFETRAPRWSLDHGPRTVLGAGHFASSAEHAAPARRSASTDPRMARLPRSETGRPAN